MKHKRKIIIIIVVLVALWLAIKGYKNSREASDNPCISTDQERLNSDNCGCQGISESSSATGTIPVAGADGVVADDYCRNPDPDEIPCRCANPDLI